MAKKIVGRLLASVVIVPFNQKELLQKTIQSLEAQTIPKKRFEVILVDESVDGTQEWIESYQKESKLNIAYVRVQPCGVDVKRNMGWRKARAPVVCFTDHDVIAEKNWLEEVLKSFSENPEAVGVEGLIRTDNPRPLFSNAPENLRGGLYPTANLSFKKSVLEKTGGNSEKYFFFREDAEMAFRCMQWGRIVFAPKAIVYHPPVFTSWKGILPNAKRLDSFVRNEVRLSKQFPKLYKKCFGGLWNVYRKDLLLSAAATAWFIAAPILSAANDWVIPFNAFIAADLLMIASATALLYSKKKNSLKECAAFSGLMAAKYLALGWMMAYYLFKHAGMEQASEERVLD